MSINAELYKYKFSIVTAVYNIELFLEEAIESVIKQDIGFKENVQLILVDDGSTDKSGTICDKYQTLYSENIIVVHKENGGVSSARNEGMKYVEGKYVNFLDGDDKLKEDALRLVYDQFEEWKESVDLITIPLFYFDGRAGQHLLNNKFAKGTRIIDLRREYDKQLLFSNATFFKREIIKKYKFDVNLSFAEDAKVVLDILLEKQKYGVLNKTNYWYRVRSAGPKSAIQTSKKNPKWYLAYIKYFSLWSIENAKLKNNSVLPLFIQNTIMYDLQWRFVSKESPELVLTKEETEEFFDTLKQVMKYIDDDIILSQKQIFIEHKLYALSLKYGHAPIANCGINDINYYYDNTYVCSESQLVTKIEFIKFNDCKIELEGDMTVPLNVGNNNKVYLELNKHLYECEEIGEKQKTISLGKTIAYTKKFRCVLPIQKNIKNEIKIVTKNNNYVAEKKNIRFGKFSPIRKEFVYSYYVSKPYILKRSKNKLCVEPYKRLNHLLYESYFLNEIRKTKKNSAYKAIISRILYYMYGAIFHKKDVWLISDRIHKADDNGEAFFEYLNKEKPKNIKYYFSISKESPDYKRLRKQGNVIKFRGWKYKWLYLCGAKIISSQGEDYVYRPFEKESCYYTDIIQKSKFVFLGHGVTKDDLSRWLEKCNKNIHIFVTTTLPEYKSILEYSYGYSENVVKLTGMPRYDRLYRDEKKYITIMPSWRAYLVSETDVYTGRRSVNKGFENSQYCKMYSELLTSNELITNAERKGYKIRFLIHPNMSACLELIRVDSKIEILKPEEITYKQIFAESDLVVTDYSSVVFDFAYLRKPVLYFQADKEEFFGGMHTYDKGYFDYEKDGFGEVAYTVDNLIQLMQQYMQLDCTLKDEYAQRIEDTFPYSDTNNSKRVFDEIFQLK